MPLVNVEHAPTRRCQSKPQSPLRPPTGGEEAVVNSLGDAFVNLSNMLASRRRTNDDQENDEKH